MLQQRETVNAVNASLQNEADYFTRHGHRLCFYILYTIVTFIPFAWLNRTENEAQRRWLNVYELLLTTGVLVPFLIEAIYMRKRGSTHRNIRRAIRSFYIAPILTFAAILLCPFIYFLYLVIGSKPGLFQKENLAWSLTIFFALLIDMSAVVLMLY